MQKFINLFHSLPLLHPHAQFYIGCLFQTPTHVVTGNTSLYPKPGHAALLPASCWHCFQAWHWKICQLHHVITGHLCGASPCGFHTLLHQGCVEDADQVLLQVLVALGTGSHIAGSHQFQDERTACCCCCRLLGLLILLPPLLLLLLLLPAATSLKLMMICQLQL